MAVAKPTFCIAGCGPGAADYISPIARRAIEGAEVFVAANHLLALFPELDVEKIPFNGNVEAVLETIAQHAGRRVAIGVSGDPGVSSLGQSVVRRFGRHACSIIPGISSVQVAFARLGLEWSDARIFSIHGRAKEEISARDLEGARKIAVLPGGPQSGAALAALYQRLEGEWKLFACENLTLEGECVLPIEAQSLPSQPRCSRSIILFIQEGLLR